MSMRALFSIPPLWLMTALFSGCAATKAQQPTLQTVMAEIDSEDRRHPLERPPAPIESAFLYAFRTTPGTVNSQDEFIEWADRMVKTFNDIMIAANHGGPNGWHMERMSGNKEGWKNFPCRFGMAGADQYLLWHGTHNRWGLSLKYNTNSQFETCD